MDVLLHQFFNFAIMAKALPLVLMGLKQTAILCAIVIPLGLVGGLLFALVSLAPSRAARWSMAVAIDFFRDNKIPFERMICTDELVGNAKNTNSRYCFAAPGEVYVVYLPDGGETELDVNAAKTPLTVKWFNPRTGGALLDGSVTQVAGPGKASLGKPPSDPDQDWVILVR